MRIALLCLLLSSCSIVPTPMKSDSGGVAYAAILGGKGMLNYNADGSMAFTYSQEKSFQHFLQMVGAAVAGWTAASVQEAKELSSRFYAGQVTKQQAQSQMAALQQAELAAKSGAYDSALKSGAEATVGTVTPP